MDFSPKLVELIKTYEGFKPLAYVCPGGHLTIGFGHRLHKDNIYKITTLQEANKLLINDLAIFSAYINQCVKVTLKQGQYDALCSLVYNWGCINFGKSKGLILLNQGKYRLASIEFFSREKGVVNIKGEFCRGLYLRRQAELKLWDKD